MKFKFLLLLLLSLEFFHHQASGIPTSRIKRESTALKAANFEDKTFWHENDENFSCFDDEKLFSVSDPNITFETTIGITGAPQMCCVEFDRKKITNFKVKHRTKSNIHASKIYQTDAWCFKEKKSLKCCCTKDKCNNPNFVLYNFNRIQYNPLIFSGVEIVFFLFSCILIAVICGGIFLVLFFTCSEKFNSDQRLDISAIKNVDLRGIIVQPYHSEAEIESIISQIKEAKTTKHAESTTFEKINFRSVTTFFTIDDLTIREAIPIEFPSLTNKNPCMEMLTYMINNGPKEIKFDPADLILCYDKALKILKSEPVLQEASLPVVVYGDLHGQYSDLIRWFHVNGWPPTTRCIFLGDYVDRGRHSLEVITLLLCLKAVMPNDVYLNRGNHEDAVICRNYSFYAEVINRLPANSRLNQKVFDKLSECFAWMPLATKLNNKILCMHGGLSPKLISWDSIADIQRPIFNLASNSLACDLTWSDPDKTTHEYMINYKRDKRNGIGYLFGYKQVKTVCEALDIKLILRGHQAPIIGYELFSPRLCTLFSAPGYRGVDEEANFGASMYIDEKGNIDITRIGVSSAVRRERNRQKLDKGEGYLDWAEIKDRPLDNDDDKTC